MKLRTPAHHLAVLDGRVVDGGSLPAKVDIDRPIEGDGLRNDVSLNVLNGVSKCAYARPNSISENLQVSRLRDQGISIALGVA